MAVLFPTPFGYTLKPNKPAELLQGFQNIQNAEGSRNGELSKSALVSYSQKRFIAADPNSAVASYLNNNFAEIAKMDGDASSISTSDLVQVRTGLPNPPAVVDPPAPPPQNQDSQSIQLILVLLLQLFSQFGMFSSGNGNNGNNGNIFGQF